MQVNSVSNYSLSPAFKSSPQEEAFAKLDDKDLQKMAYNKASNDVNDRKHRRIDNALYYSLPLAAGLSAAVTKFSPEETAIIGKNMRFARLKSFGTVAAFWAAGLAVVNAVWGAKDFLANRSKKVKDFVNNNPVLTSIGTFALGAAAVMGAYRGGIKGLNKLWETLVKNGKAEKIAAREQKVSDALNSSKLLDRASDFLKKTPAPIKEIGRTVADWAPWIVVGTQLAHTFGHESAKAKDTVKNYNEFKDAQNIVREDIADEQIEKALDDMSVQDLHKEYVKMLNSKPIIDSQTGEPISFEDFVHLAMTRV